MVCDPQRMRMLTTSEALRQLGSVPLGRIVFTALALPTLRPVNHIVDDGVVIVYLYSGAAALDAIDQIVAYEADTIDVQTHTGWAVIAIGRATLVEDPDEASGYRDMPHPPGRPDTTHVARIRPEIITGYELVNR